MDYALLVLFGILTIVAVASVAPKLGVAAPLVLVVIGTACSFIPALPPIEFPPGLILSLVLPPILYAAAVNVPLVDLRRNIKPIAGLSVLLVIVSALATGLLFYWLLPALSLPAAIALGAVISPPDAVAATSIAKRLGLPPRLVTVLEGEGLVNDASALVLLRSAVAATAGSVALWEVVGGFVLAAVVAIVVGLVIGHLTVWVRSKLLNPVLNTTVSFAVPFLAYLPADELQASGVLAVVVAGLVTGHQSAKHFNAQIRISERVNWRTVQFVLENGVFLLMGLELKTLVVQVRDESSLLQAIGFGLLATGLLIVVRIAFVVPLIALLRRDQRRAAQAGKDLESAIRHLDRPKSEAADAPARMSAPTTGRARRFLVRRRADVDSLTADGLGWRGGAVLAWSGMRGVVTLAAAESLPDIPYRAQLVLIAFIVAIVTLLVQGSTLPVLIKALRIVGTDSGADRQELATLVRQVSAKGLAALDNPNLVQKNGAPFDPAVMDRVRADSQLIGESLREQANVDEAEPPGFAGLDTTEEPSAVDDSAATIGPHQQHRTLRLRVLRAERDALLEARATGAFSSRVMERAQHMIDLEESRLAQLSDDDF
ncbi:cation:proton antiporter [Cryobacterium tepidiphilum]|uniref:Sodium:proton antiporter n=1 Tax=Cryobacterium tepidiphilum TaxID=2486026 RepID=A0A3M8KUK0_9MICO|nr:sodium:proton antiporter [Cryobacterium tepidiphilum]RNE56816.1 sodium:proton antiporter [Cryobacterium tepidiphilum]